MPDFGNGHALRTIKNGVVPSTRMADAQGVIDFVQRTQEADDLRSKQRAHVDGIVDGNPPFNPASLRKNNAAGRCNVNWGTGRSYLEASSGAFYDLTSQAPGTVQILQYHGNSENQVEWSRIMSEIADTLFARNRSWKTHNQISINETVLHSTGPLFFSNHHQSFPKSIESGMLLLPDKSSCDLDEWEISAVLFDYYPPKLYEFISNPEAAKAVGWDVEYTRTVIEYAIDQKQPEQRTQNWEWYQNELKSKSFEYFNQTLVCKLAHVWWREFDNRVTHVIVERPGAGSNKSPKFLFKSVGLYDNFYQAVHPMYYDVGRGGYHHNTTGLGTKMGPAMAYENRLLCRLMDGAFAPKILFSPNTAEAREKFQMATFSDYAVLPPGVTAVQAPVQGFLNDGLAMFRTSSDLMRSNLSAYRQPVEPEKPGNPSTKFEVGLRAAQAGSLSNTVFERYYEQRDALYAEIVRRLCNLNSTDKWAMQYQKMCMDKGVPKECFGCVESVTATRVIGQGSPFLRQAVTEKLLEVIGRLPDSGQRNLLNDFLSSHAGQKGPPRYNPQTGPSQNQTDQHERANLQVVGAKIGKAPDFSGSQDPFIFASTYNQACTDAINSIQQGGNPKEVVSFIDLVAPASWRHITRLQADPTRAGIAQKLEEQFHTIGAIQDKLKAQIQANDEQQKEQAAKTQQALNDQQLKELKVKGDLALKTAKTKHNMSIKDATTRQNMALSDARTSSEIALAHARTQAETTKEE